LEKEFRDLYLFEIDQNNVDILERKYNQENIHIRKTDWMETETTEPVDKIVMNPPFTKSQDVKHILHAYSLLKE